MMLPGLTSLTGGSGGKQEGQKRRRDGPVANGLTCLHIGRPACPVREVQTITKVRRRIGAFRCFSAG